MIALSANLRALLDAEYPRFSDAEMARRRVAVDTVLAEAGAELTRDGVNDSMQVGATIHVIC